VEKAHLWRPAAVAQDLKAAVWAGPPGDVVGGTSGWRRGRSGGNGGPLGSVGGTSRR
jgi:hypothetical protein